MCIGFVCSAHLSPSSRNTNLDFLWQQLKDGREKYLVFRGSGDWFKNRHVIQCGPIRVRPRTIRTVVKSVGESSFPTGLEPEWMLAGASQDHGGEEGYLRAKTRPEITAAEIRAR